TTGGTASACTSPGSPTPPRCCPPWPPWRRPWRRWTPARTGARSTRWTGPRCAAGTNGSATSPSWCGRTTRPASSATPGWTRCSADPGRVLTGRLEEIDQGTGRGGEQDLAPARTGDRLAAERQPGPAEPVDL